MKLLYCMKCQGVVRLVMEERECECGNAKGVYKDYVNATWSEKEEDTVVPFGIHNSQFRGAIASRNAGVRSFTPSLTFEAWVMSKDVKVFTKEH